ncbi:hypothetical protein [Burkholderia sp. SCN-KJ]|uniref:hypothetical protein n=1 Tax=Burkholderia sp. SCN-KJ TaxID=2969248 RepID=UPI002150082B|nr:hypothetical protein [Burkholderia sp. SCN-KJ]MCR4468178.1 hypothetical protein [Burkholderia sp. SCN-KJ]
MNANGCMQRGGVRQFGIECDAAAHIDDRCKCEHAHRMQEQKFFPATSAQFIQIATASDSRKSKSGMAALLSHQTGSLVNRCFACCRGRTRCSANTGLRRTFTVVVDSKNLLIGF